METYVALVTGGSGFLGQHVVKHLQLYADDVREIRVLDLAQYEQKLAFEARKPISSFTGSLLDDELVREACTGADVIFHIASYIDTRFQPDVKMLEQINVEGTRRLLNIAIEENVRYFLYCGSCSIVQGYREVRGGTETSNPPPSKYKLMFRDYGDSKQKAQKMVLESDKLQYENGTCLRTLSLIPLTMYGELDLNMVTYSLRAAAENNGVLMKFGSEKALCQVAYVGNSAWAFVCAFKAIVNTPDEVGGTFFFIPDDTEPQPMFKFVIPYLSCRNFQVSSVSIPAIPLYVLVFILQFLSYVISPVYRFTFKLSLSALLFSETTFYLTYDKAKTLFPYSPLYSPEVAMGNSIEYYSQLQLH